MRRSPALAAPLCLSLLLACAAPSHEYVRNTDVRAAFKVPTAWNVFSKDLVLGIQPGPPADTPDPIKWLVGIDGDPSASVSHVLDSSNLASDHPEGVALVQDLSFTEHDSANLTYLRNFLFPVDQLIQNDSSARVVAYDDKLNKDGFTGIHLEFQFREAALGELRSSSGTDTGGSDTSSLQTALLGGQGVAVLSPDFVQVSQTVYMDRDAGRIYFLAVLCSAQCYARNRADIQSTVDSWTVLP